MKSLVLLVALYVALIVGEIRCICKFFTSDFESSYKREIIYGVGMVTGLGAVIGYMNIEDTPKTN